MTMYVVYLLRKKKLNKMMTSFQILRTTLLLLSRDNWCQKGISLAEFTGDSQQVSPEEFQKYDDVVFIGPSGYLNLCSGMTSQTFNRVASQAALGLKHVDKLTADGFQALLMTPAPFHKTFDSIIRISNCKDLIKVVNEKDENKHKFMELHKDIRMTVLSQLLKLLCKGLGKRVDMICHNLVNSKQWSISSRPSDPDAAPIEIGILLNLDHCSNLLEKGPMADSKEAPEFRKFWCNKSEMRRFHDGTICEAVVWECKTIADRRQVPNKICHFLLKNHFNVLGKNITLCGNQYDKLLKPVILKEDKSRIYGTGEEENISVMKSYDELCRQVRQLNDLPLAINMVQGTSPVFRFAEVFPPTEFPENQVDISVCHEHTPWIPTMKVICVLEGSGKWPEDIDAVQRIKAAFHIKLSDLLILKHKLLTRVHPGFVDVFKDGFVFRLQVGYLYEISMLKMTENDDGMVKIQETERSNELEKAIVFEPRLASALHGIQQKNNTFTSVVRLAKRWISAQMFSPFISDEAIELIVAHLYLNPAPFTEPSSISVGFLRFLTLLTRHDWKLSPLILNFNESIPKAELDELHSKFDKSRSSLPLTFLATPFDNLKSVWTINGPTAPILKRLVLLAQEALNILGESENIDIKQIFRPSLGFYDVLIHLDPAVLSRGCHAVDFDKLSPKIRLKGTKTLKEFPVTDFDPVEFYMNDLQTAYGEIALFFNDKYGGKTIGVLWKPQIFESKPFKIPNLFYHQLDASNTESEPKLTVAIEAVLEDFLVLGEGLVENIVVRKISNSPLEKPRLLSYDR